MAMMTGMAKPVTVATPDGAEFQCSRLQWERIFHPRGCRLVADEDGRRTPASRVKAKPTDTDSKDTD